MNSIRKVNTIFSTNVLNTYTLIDNTNTTTSVRKGTGGTPTPNPTGSGTGSATATLDLYVTLSRYSNIINNLLNLYLNDFDSFKNTYTNDLYLELVLALSVRAVDPIAFPGYEKTRLALIAALRTLNLELTSISSLRENNRLLREQIENMQDCHNDMSNPRTALFPEMSAQVVMATIRPEYTEYIRLYGYNGSFDPVALATIKAKMGLL
jgi:hypothetical protein